MKRRKGMQAFGVLLRSEIAGAHVCEKKKVKVFLLLLLNKTLEGISTEQVKSHKNANDKEKYGR